MYKLLPVLLILLLLSCDRKPFVEHKISIDQKSEDCSSLQENFRLNSNFGGERFEFEKCLPAGYDKSLVKTERRGDTVLVDFPVEDGFSKKVVYQVTLDIDSYPKYSFVTIGDDTYTIIPNSN